MANTNNRAHRKHVQREQNCPHATAPSPAKPPVYLIRRKAVQWKHGADVWGLQLAQVAQHGHVPQDAAVHSPGKPPQHVKARQLHSTIPTGSPRQPCTTAVSHKISS